jgi:hypothetical protein
MANPKRNPQIKSAEKSLWKDFFDMVTSINIGRMIHSTPLNPNPELILAAGDKTPQTDESGIITVHQKSWQIEKAEQ